MRLENVIGDIELSGDGGEGSLYESWSHFGLEKWGKQGSTIGFLDILGVFV